MLTFGIVLVDVTCVCLKYCVDGNLRKFAKLELWWSAKVMLFLDLTLHRGMKKRVCMVKK